MMPNFFNNPVMSPGTPMGQPIHFNNGFNGMPIGSPLASPGMGMGMGHGMGGLGGLGGMGGMMGNGMGGMGGIPQPQAARRRLWTWGFPCCAAVTLLIALILGIIGLAVPYWLSGDVPLLGQSVNRHMGIWSTCGNVVGGVIDTDCISWDDLFDAFPCPDLEEIMVALQVLTILSMVLILFAIILIIIGAACYSLIGFACAGLAMFIAIILLIVAVSVFGAQVPGVAYACAVPGVIFSNGEFCPGCSLDWGWVLTLLSLILTFIALLLTYCACWFHRRKKAKYVAVPPPIPPPAPPVALAPACCPVPIASPCYSPCSPVLVAEDPLLSRVDLVHNRLANTLMHDAVRMHHGPVYTGSIGGPMGPVFL